MRKRLRLSPAIWAGALVAFTMGWVSMPAFATPTVNCSTDDLAAAIAAASPGDTLSISGLCIGDFVLGKNLNLVSASGAILEGDGQEPTLTVNEVTATVVGLTIRGSVDNDGPAGGIRNHGVLAISSSKVTGNVGFGGIYNDGSVTMTNSEVSGNRGEGGGISNDGALVIQDSLVTANRAGGYFGGGIYNSPTATLTLSGSALEGNDSELPHGGGFGSNDVYSEGSGTIDDSDIDDLIQFGGTLHLTHSSVTSLDVDKNAHVSVVQSSVTYLSNGYLTATSDGGASVSVAESDVNELRDTNTGNSYIAHSHVVSLISDFRGYATVDRSFIESAAINFGGISPIIEASHSTIGAMYGSGGHLILRGTILLHCEGHSADFHDDGYNLDKDGSCHWTEASSVSHADPLLNANGVPAPLSAAVDAIPVGTTVYDTFLQSSATICDGLSPSEGVACDIGVYEARAPWIAGATVSSGVGGMSSSVSGTITCNRAAPFSVTITLKQPKKKKGHGTAHGTCDGGTPVVWTAHITSAKVFSPGSAKVTFVAKNGKVKRKGKSPVSLA